MPRIRPQSNNIKIKVSTQQTDDTVNVSTTNGTNPVKASNNMAEYWSNKSKEWAISENIVDNTDHSSKYYAEQAKEAYDGIDELVNGFEQTVEDATTNSIEEITESKDDAIADIIIEGGNQVNLVESTGGDLITQMTSLKDATLGYKNDAQSSANSASVSETNAHTYETNALSYSNSASGSASIATQKATEAASSAINASESELNALAYSNSASSSASNASTSESNASTSETNAQTYANNANTSATNAATSEDNANIWAEGSDAEVQALGGVHSSKGWAEVSSSGQVQSDYTESDSTKKSFIKNKPDLTVYATQTDLTNGLATKQDTLIAGTDLEIIPAQAPILPEGFTQIEYIEGTGTQYIDTGFYGTQNSGAHIKFALTDLTSEGSARVFGTRNGSGGTGAFAFISSFDGTTSADDYFFVAANGSNTSGRVYSINTEWNEVSCNVENDKKSYFNNNLLFTGNSTAFTSNAQASIFRTYNRTSYGLPATAKISVLRIYENAVLVHNYIPCRRDSDDELGMYDLVSDTFFTNSGTGTFIAGPDVIFPETDLINFTNESGYIKGIDSTDVITALGYTPYDSTNPNGFTSNVGTVTSVNNTQPDANGNVTIQTGGATDVQINGTSITNQGVANIVTNSAYDASSNKIATMSDLPADEIFVAEYNVTTYQQVLDAYNAGKTVFACNNIFRYYSLTGRVLRTSPDTYGFQFSCFNGSWSFIFILWEDDNWESLTSNLLTRSDNQTAVGSSTKPIYISSAGVATASTSTIGGSSTPVYLNNGTITASTSTVGSSTTPVYLDSGTITSTGLSIASSRFDGQWVQVSSAVQLTLEYTPSTASVYSISLTSYLPSGTDKYDVLLYASLLTTSSGNSIACYLGSDLFPITTSTYTKGILLAQARTRTSSSMTVGASCILPVGSSKTVYLFAPPNWRNGTINLFMTAYRRIGTNS